MNTLRSSMMPAASYRYFALHKPYGMLSQFVGGHPGLRMLSHLPYAFPEGIHAIGRLDYTSEGLLLLTTDPAVTKRLFHPDARHPRSYLVNVYWPVADSKLERLATGIPIRI
jgi:23S rRNA pseudouridine2457 synthase